MMVVAVKSCLRKPGQGVDKLLDQQVRLGDHAGASAILLDGRCKGQDDDAIDRVESLPALVHMPVLSQPSTHALWATPKGEGRRAWLRRV